MALTLSNIVQANKTIQCLGISVFPSVCAILFFPQFRFLRKSQSQLTFTQEIIQFIVTFLILEYVNSLTRAQNSCQGLAFTDDKRYSDI